MVADEDNETRQRKLKILGSRGEDVTFNFEDIPPPKVPRLLGPILHQRFMGISRGSACPRSSP